MSAERPVAVITGGSRGIGRALVVEAARRGHDVLFTHRGRGSDAADTEAAAEPFGTRVVGLQADVARAEDIESIGRAAIELGPVGVLVNNAGLLVEGTVEDTVMTDWSMSFDIHARAPMLLTKVLAAELGRVRGCIVNIATDGAIVGSVHGPAYGASKAAMVGLSKTLARELAPRIRVNSLCPGPIATDMWDAIAEQDRARVEAETPMRRVGTPEEVARACFDITTWTYVTGQTVVLDGGRVML